MKKHNSFLFFLESKIQGISYTGRWLFIAFFALLIIGVIGGIIGLSNLFTIEKPSFGGTYHEGILGTPRFINPILAFSESDHDLTKLVYNGLVRLDAQGNIIADLASEWTISEDGKIYTFFLKPNLVFHDKKPVTAYDVVFTIEAIQNPLTKSPLRIAWTGITVSAPDAKTVVFELPRAYSGFLNQATVGIIPMHLWKNYKTYEEWQVSPLNIEPIGSGPFKITSITRSKNGTPRVFYLKRFKKFGLGKPFIKKIKLSIFPNNQELIDAFKSKKIDGFISTSIIFDQLKNIKTAVTVTESAPKIFSIFINGEKNNILRDTNILQAMKLIAPKQEIIDSVFHGYADPLSGPLPFFIDQSAGEDKKILAEQILERAGWKKNPETGIREKGTQKLDFNLATANSPELRKSADIIQKAFFDIGIQITVQSFEIGTLQESVIRKREFELLLFGQVIKHDTDIFAFWHSSQRNDPGLNITNYFNVRTDSLLDQTLAQNDRDTRMGLYEQISRELAQGPVIFLYSPKTVFYTRNHVLGTSLPPLGQYADRFTMIYQWYLYTHNVWTVFSR